MRERLIADERAATADRISSLAAQVLAAGA
jgi:hypothetical protein